MMGVRGEGGRRETEHWLSYPPAPGRKGSCPLCDSRQCLFLALCQNHRHTQFSRDSMCRQQVAAAVVSFCGVLRMVRLKKWNRKHTPVDSNMKPDHTLSLLLPCLLVSLPWTISFHTHCVLIGVWSTPVVLLWQNDSVSCCPLAASSRTGKWLKNCFPSYFCAAF